jgi:hypothetical protein
MNDESVIREQQREIDRLRRRIAVLERSRDICGQIGELHPECRLWLVSQGKLKAGRVRKDGR